MKIVRYILGYNSRHHLVCNDFKKVKYLDVPTRFEYLSLNMMYSIYNNLAPAYLCNFQKLSDVHTHNTRNSSMSYVIPHVKSQGSNSFMFNGAKSWNNLPVSVRSVVTKDNFKQKCKCYLFGQMADREDSQFTV